MPLSTGMPDHWTNIMFLTNEEHIKVHKILNVPYSRIRLFKKATNGMLVVNDFYLQEQYLLLLEYFKNFSKLPLDIQTLHALHMQETCEFYSKEWNIEIFPETGQTSKEHFFKHLKLYFSLLKIRIKR